LNDARRSRVRRLASACAVALLAAACTDGSKPPPSAPASGGTPAVDASSPTAEPPAFELAVDLRDVRVAGVRGGLRPRDLREPTRAIRRTMTELYSIGFVDPSAWDGGEFSSLFPLFAGEARRQAEQDLQRLTLGRLATQLDAVRPRRARLHVRFLADAADRAVVAVADMRFEGVGIDGDDEREIRQDGEYTLRRVHGGWRVVAYDVVDRSIEKPTPASFAPGFPSRGPLFVLVIGSDARPGQSVTGARADTLHLVGVNPQQGRVSVLGIPRDSWVTIPGARGPARSTRRWPAAGPSSSCKPSSASPASRSARTS